MLTTILGQVTRFFDRRAIVSAFSPSVVFWAVALVIVFGTRKGWQPTLDAWAGLGGTAKAVLVTAFVVWVVFWTFLTLSFRASLIRLYEGYGDDLPLIRPLDRLRERSRRRWRELDRRERELGEEELRLDEAVEGGDAAATDELAAATRQRLQLVTELSVYFPREQADVMPTRLGNILKAAELYSWDRYRLDSVVVWPRLAAAGGVPEALRDTETSLHLMITVSAFSVLFGLPAAAWLAVETSEAPPWWTAVLLAALALALRSAVGAVVALAAVAGAVVAAVGKEGAVFDRIEIVLVVAAVSLVVAALAYRSAVQAAAAYGEEVKATIDVHRRTVLEALHLQLPSNLEEERRLWLALAQLVQHGATPDPAVYRFEES